MEANRGVPGPAHDDRAPLREARKPSRSSSKLDSSYAYSAELDASIQSRTPDQSGMPSPNTTPGAPAGSGFLPPPPSLNGLPSYPVGLQGREREIEVMLSTT